MLGMFLRARAQATVAVSKGNLKNIGTALETYFIDQGEYPAALSWLVPLYARAIPDDPCTNGAYAYDTSMGGIPPVNYKVSIGYPLTNPCRVIVSGLSYTAAGGLEEGP